MYQVKIDTVIDDNYYREGDVLRQEAPTGEDLVKAAKMIAEKVPSYGKMTFFDWDTSSIKKYEQAISEIYSIR